MMWVRNQARDDAQNGERLNFQVGHTGAAVFLGNCNQSVVLLVAVYKLDDPSPHESHKVVHTGFDILQAFISRRFEACASYERARDASD
jgi:hypothetical protein